VCVLFTFSHLCCGVSVLGTVGHLYVGSRMCVLFTVGCGMCVVHCQPSLARGVCAVHCQPTECCGVCVLGTISHLHVGVCVCAVHCQPSLCCGMWLCTVSHLCAVLCVLFTVSHLCVVVCALGTIRFFTGLLGVKLARL